MRGCFGERRWRIALGTAAAVLLTTALPALALRVPDSSGDQLIYVYDARENRVPFLNVVLCDAMQVGEPACQIRGVHVVEAASRFVAIADECDAAAVG